MLYILFGWMLALGSITAGLFQQYSIADFDRGLDVLENSAGKNEKAYTAELRQAFKTLYDEKIEVTRRKDEKSKSNVKFQFDLGGWGSWILHGFIFLWLLPLYRKRFLKGEIDPEVIERRIVGLPVVLFILVWVAAVERYFSSAGLYRELYGDPNIKIQSIFAASSFLMGAFAGYLNLELTTLYIRRFIAQPYFVENNPHGLKRGMKIGLTMRYALMVFSLAMVPLAFCVYVQANFNWDFLSALRGAPDSRMFFENAGVIVPLLMCAVIASIMLFFHVLSILLFRWNIQLPLGSLIDRMRSVAMGDFTAKTKVLDSDEIGELKGHFNMMLDGLQEREKIKDTFGKYVSMEIAEKILKTGSVDLAGEEIEATILFSDLRNFTPLSEKMSPRDLVAFLNAYFGKITAPIMTEKGVINKFIGDAVMAIFSPVFGVEDHAAAGLRAAVGMKAALSEFNAAGKYPSVAFGVGLHTGTLIAGNVGTKDRLEYTVLGDTVNVASRIESQTKMQDVDILISDALKAAAGDVVPGGVSLVGIGPVLMKGKSKPMELFRVDVTGSSEEG